MNMGLCLSIQMSPIEYGPSCLKALHSYLSGASEAGKIFLSLLDVSDYRCFEDFLLAVFLPPVRPNIKAFYDEKGKNMVSTFQRSFIKEVDWKILQGVKIGDGLWSLCKDEADRQGVTREEMLQFLSPKLSGIFQPLKGYNLERYYLPSYRQWLLEQ